jgi:hypothetical protein
LSDPAKQSKKRYALVSELLFNAKQAIISAIYRREQVTFDELMMVSAFY